MLDYLIEEHPKMGNANSFDETVFRGAAMAIGPDKTTCMIQTKFQVVSANLLMVMDVTDHNHNSWKGLSIQLNATMPQNQAVFPTILTMGSLLVPTM